MISIKTGTVELLCEIKERVATISLNKPHKKNALGDVLTPALRKTIALLEDDDRVGVVLITGVGLSLIHISEPTRPERIAYAR